MMSRRSSLGVNKSFAFLRKAHEHGKQANKHDETPYLVINSPKPCVHEVKQKSQNAENDNIMAHGRRHLLSCSRSSHRSTPRQGQRRRLFAGAAAAAAAAALNESE